MPSEIDFDRSGSRRRPHAARLPVTSVLAFVLAVTCAGGAVLAGTLPTLSASPGPSAWAARVQESARTEVDTVVMLGGPGTVDGRFESPSGLPHWHGWTHEDATAAESHWHVNEFMAPSGQYALWCGRYYGDDPGYGNNWNDPVVFGHAVADPGAGCVVHWTANLRCDSEPFWDFVYCEVRRGDHWEELASVSGDTLLALDVMIALEPGDYAGPGGDEVQLRVRFASDGGVSDADGNLDSDGACQLDDVTVAIDSVPVSQEDFEDGASDDWRPASLAVGDFAALYRGLHELDPCVDNHTAQVAFIDDGVVVPGTGGSPCITWCYGPDGYIVNSTGGLVGPEAHLLNRVVSPVMPWPEGTDAMRLELTAYVHQMGGNPVNWPGVLYQLLVRSTSDPVTAPIEDQVWQNPGNNYYYGGPGYRRHVLDLTAHLVPGRVEVQVALQVGDYGYMFHLDGADGSPAPYFDNVRCLAYPYTGPSIGTEVDALAQDAFPAQGDIDPADLQSNSVRFDSARNIAGYDAPHVDPGDSLVIAVNPVRAGSVLVGPPWMLVCMRANPLFDGVRQLPPLFARVGERIYGSVAGTLVEAPAPPDVRQEPSRYAFDLPDTGFFFPGDVIHYCFVARDDLDGEVGVTMLPGDTTGFADFDLGSRYDVFGTVRALPTLRSATPGDQPRVLFWDDGSDRPSVWRSALHQLGYHPGADYDHFLTRSPDSGWRNGLGTHATSATMAGYEVLIYTSGGHPVFTLETRDAELLSSWFARGGKHGLMTGDGLVGDLQGGDSSVQAFFNTYVGAEYHGGDVSRLIDGQLAPRVRTVPGNGYVATVDEWIAYGGCPDLRTFDALVPGPGGAAIAEFLDPTGNGGQYPYAAALVNRHEADDATVVVLPHELSSILNAPDWDPPAGRAGIAARALILDDILLACGQMADSPPVAVAPREVLAVTAAPNPFNPQVGLELYLPRRSEVRMVVYDLRGRLVRRVFEGVLPAGRRAVIWDGAGDDGRPAASGVYFCETRAGDEVVVSKLALVR